MEEKKQQSLKTFNQQAQTYDSDSHGLHARRLYPHMLQAIIQVRGNKVLDLGCGTGELMIQVLQEDRSREITGLDLSENMLIVAKQKLANYATFVLGDSEHLPFSDESFDLIYCNDSFHHYPQPKKVLSEMNRVLRKEGTIIIGDCYQKGIARLLMNLFMTFSHDGDVHMYSKKEMENLLGEYFHQIRWQQVNSTSYVIKGVK